MKSMSGSLAPAGIKNRNFSTMSTDSANNPEFDKIQDPYIRAQLKCHWKKRKRQRNVKEYEAVVRIAALHLIHNDPTVICMGTRNNWERDELKRLFKAQKCVSVDIAPASEADWIGSFDDIPEEWNSTFDVIYSNALDHSRNVNETVRRWSHLLRREGIMVMGYDPCHSKLNDSDCSFVTNDILCNIASELQFSVLEKSIKAIEYTYTIIRKES